jgi:hypothetical protein
MRVRFVTAVLILIWAVVSAPAAFAGTPDEDFAEAENTFKFQDYENASKMLEALLYPKIRITDPEKQIRAHEYLAASHF